MQEDSAVGLALPSHVRPKPVVVRAVSPISEKPKSGPKGGRWATALAVALIALIYAYFYFAAGRGFFMVP